MVGVGTAAAVGAAAAAGAWISGRSTKSDDDEEGVRGSVSRRISALESGESASASPYVAQSENPNFVAVPRSKGSRLSQMDSVQESSYGIEVEGPVRPSSAYSISYTPESSASYSAYSM